MVFLFDEVDVVGGNYFEVEFLCEVAEDGDVFGLLFELMVHEFDVEVFGPVDVFEGLYFLAGFVEVTFGEPFVDGAFAAAAEADDAFCVLA